MKIGIYFDSSLSQGGIYHHNISLIDIFKENLSPDFDITYITHQDNLIKIFQDKNCKYLKLNKNLSIKFLFNFKYLQFLS